MFEELFKDVNNKKDREEFVKALKMMEESQLYDVINSYDESSKADIISFISNKAKIVGETALWKAKQKIFIKKEKNKKGEFNNDPNFTEFTNQPIELYCGEWIANDNCIYKEKGGAQLVASYQPILITKRYINKENVTEKFELSYYDENRWKTKIVSRETTSSASSITKLVNYGIDVSPETAYHLSNYLNKLYTLNKDVIPVERSISRLGWVDNDFVPYSDKYVFDGEIEFQELYNSVTQKGSFEEWCKVIGDLRLKSETLRLLIATSFASPLNYFLNVNPFIVHFWGTSGKGKTVSLNICASIWGHPKKLTQDFKSSQFAFESKFNFFRHLPCILDELKEAKEKFKPISSMVYFFASGHGGDKGKKDGGIHEIKEWNNLFITNGEEPITSSIDPEGVKNRVIEVNENNTIIENGREVVNFILENYGHPGRYFIDYIIKNNMEEEIKERYNKLLDDYNKKYDTKYQKQVNTLMYILLADILVSEIIFHTEPLTIEDMMKYFRHDTDEIDRIYDYLVNMCLLKENSFFDTKKATKKDTKKDVGDVIGRIEYEEGGIKKYYINHNVVDDWLEKKQITFDKCKKRLLEKRIYRM